jgi:hypothetical protein
MSDPSLALQGAIVAALKAIGSPAGANVFDRVPDSNPFPRITVGGGQSVPVDEDCYEGTESTIQIDAWSREVGYPQVKQIASAVRGRLHNGDLTLTGHTLELMKIESITYERDSDGLTSRARIQLRALTQPKD